MSRIKLQDLEEIAQRCARQVLVGLVNDMLEAGIDVINPSKVEPECGMGGSCKECSARKDLNDPAKLAEIMAEELRRRGVDAYADPTPDIRRLPCVTIWSPCFGNNLTVMRLDDAGYVITNASLTLPQARAALLRILTMPDETPANDVLKALDAP